ncbi:hypothetical protein BDB01DRAFT_900629 [Pilobolus umbonatus]|nr:hypothetical protein BDB01DRAFT_900629 [Pilobolus umbonatus]
MNTSILLKSTIGAIGRTGLATTYKQTVPLASIHLSAICRRESVINQAKETVNDVNQKVSKNVNSAVDEASKKAHNTKVDVERKASDYAGDIKRSATETKDSASETINDIKHEAEKKIPSKKTVIDTVKDIGHKANMKTGEGLSEGVKIVEEVVGKTKEVIELGKKKVVETAEHLKEKTGVDVTPQAHEASAKADNLKHTADSKLKQADQKAHELKKETSNKADKAEKTVDRKMN